MLLLHAIYSTSWLDKFKKWHGICQLRICGDKASADVEASELFVDEFSEVIQTENISQELMYNADETALYWRYMPRKKLAITERNATE